MMTIGLCGKSFCKSAAKNGCAGTAIPENDSAPPFSSRQAKDCTAGVCKISANNLPAADEDLLCAKRVKSRSESGRRQAALLKASKVDWFFRAIDREQLQIFARIYVEIGHIIHALKLKAVTGQKRHGL